MEDYVYNMF